MSGSSANLEIESISESVKITRLRDFISGKGLVYKVITERDGSTKILYSWEFPDHADLSGLCINYIDAGCKSSRTLPCQVVDSRIIFAIPDDNHFPVTSLHRDYGVLPFSGC